MIGREGVCAVTYIEYLNRFNCWTENNDLPLCSVVLYYRMLDRFNRNGWPGNLRVDTLRLMMMSGCQSKGAAYRARDALAQAGFIRFERGSKGKPTTYFLSDILSFKTTESGTVNRTESGTENGTINEPQRERPKTKKKTFPPKAPQGDPPPQPLQTGFEPVLQEAFEEWLSYKRERRETYKPTGLQSLVTQIRKAAGEYGAGAVASLIQQSMANGYRGIVFDRLSRSAPLSGDKAAHQGSPGSAFPDYTNREGSL